VAAKTLSNSGGLMESVFVFAGIVFVLFLATLGFLEIGRRLGMRAKRKEGEAAGGISAIDGAVFGLMGLLIAFTFSGAADRFETRRHLIVEETNAIGTAYRRVDLLPASVQPKLRQDFRDYTDARLGFYSNLAGNPPVAREDLVRSQTLQNVIWKESVAAAVQLNSPATTQLVLSSLNEMIDLTTSRAVALETHPPLMIYIVLTILILVSSLLAGHEMAAAGKASRVHLLVFASILAMTLYLILDLEFPRYGFIRVDATDHFMREMRNDMK
jgi:hypothetical protein